MRNPESITAHMFQPIIYKTLTIDLILNHYLRFKFVVLVFVTFGVRAYSQTKNNISFLYRADRNDVGDIHGANGDFGYYTENGSFTVLFTTGILPGYFRWKLVYNFLLIKQR